MAPFRLYVTHVDGEGPFLRVSGQLDQQSSLMVESLFEAARENLENGVGTVSPAAIHEGVICAAKYKDGIYYRAKIINTANLATGLVGVHFIDFGNKDIISLSTIRFLDNYDPMFLQLRGQANDYYLSRVVSPLGRWEEPLLLKLQSLLCYAEYAANIEAHTRSLPLISIQFKGNDLSTHLVSVRIGVALPMTKQEVLLLQMSSETPQTGNWQSNNEPSSYTEHVPFLINQNFPSNPASAMRLQQNVSIPFNGTVPPPSIISQRLLVNKASRNTVNLKPVRQPQHANQPAAANSPAPVNKGAPTSPQSSKLGSPKKSTTYKSRLLEVNSQHKVFVSFAEEGPELFAVQLVTDAKKLQDMMDDINRRPHRSLTEPPMIGTVCLGRMSGDRIICRAIVMNLSGSQCKLFFVDFGDTEMVSYYDIFDIPEEFVKPNVFAMRFCLSKVKELEKGPHLNETFKHLVNGKVLTLKVVSPEGPPLIQYGELYFDNRNILDLLMANMKDKLQFKWMEMLPLGTKQSVLVSYVDSCIKFYIQISDKIDELKVVMDAVKIHCENSSSPGELPVGAACCARFPDDDAWYRARVRDVKDNKVIVAYVDYGNEQEVDIKDLRTITPELMKLPAQAMKCALKGFENKPLETKTSNQLEMLALEKTLMAHIVGVLSNDTMLVSLVDDTVSPPMDIARRMNQLSQPRSSHETKVTTPVRKEAPESFSSPEGSVPDDGRKKNFRREKSFKEDRRPPREPNEELPQRGGSFRGRDNKEGFDRSGPGRYSDKFGGRPERGERRGGSKPWENNVPTATSPEETPSESRSDHSASGKQQYGRRKPRSDQQERGERGERGERAVKGAWRKPESGVGKRLRQAAEAASTVAPSVALSAPPSAPRHRRDNREKFNNREDREERNGDDRWNRGRDQRDGREGRDSRPERRERRDWNDKKDNHQQYQRHDRPRSNFTPRDRAERSFGSDTDKPHRPRDIPRPTCRQLADPVPLTEPYVEPTVEPGSQHEVSVTWIVSPENFFCQILSEQPSFLAMMHRIPELYKGVKSYAGPVDVGASVLARYPVDGVLYRATIVAIQPFSKYIVRYVDFGNKQLVDAKDLWQLERQLMELPKMAVHCSLVGVVPKDGEWKADPEIDLCFNAPRYQCVFQDCSEEQYKVSLWNNNISVADILVEKQLAGLSEHQSSVTLKDEAIDLMIIVGQQIPCRVTHVESCEKFFVQLDLEKATLVENAIANFDIAKLTPLSADSLMDGIHCTVKHEDKIYRAILEDISDLSNIKASLPDYGNEISTKLENLMILPTELSVYYYQALKCCLNNYNSESKTLMTVDELKQKLTGNKFIIFINSVEEICLVTTLYDIKTGQKIPIFEPDKGAYDEVMQLCTRSVFNYNFGLAYLSHAENLNEIYMQKASDGDKIAHILEELYNFYEEGTPEPLTNFEVNDLCAVKSSDSNWYRATILAINDSGVKVQFPDYGNCETVSKESLKKLDPKFYEPCSLALVAGLGLVALQDDALPKLLEWTNEKEIQVTVAFGNDGWLASLHIDGVDLSMKLVNEKLATPKVDTVEQPITEPVHTEEPISLPEGCSQVYISHIDSPGLFWLQMLDKIDKIEEIQAELQTNFKSYKDIDGRDLETLCVAKYSADGQWYRAEILDSDSDITTVRFIDYGNTDVLDNEPGLIKEIPEKLKEIERYALKSSVNAIPTGTGQWSEPASDYFTELVGDLSAPVDARIVLKDTLTYVDIYVNGQNLTDKLVSEGHATRSEEPECGDLPSCFASHVNSPSEFWIQLENATPDLQAMEAAMVDAENFPELTDKEEGVICAAKYPEDGEWYRAQVIVDGSEGTEVLFMDYGNASIANELRNLPDELKLKPALSRKCALQKPRDIKSWSRKSELKFNELAAEGATIFNVQFIAAGDISIVELYLDGKSVTEDLLGLCDDPPPPERPTPVGQDLLCNGKLCYVNSIDEFYVQLNDSITNLDKVIEKLGLAEDFDEVVDLKVGSLCAAFWSEDEQWYRAKVLEFCDVGYHVQFIDYGNKAKCEEFRQLSEDIAVIEPLAKCCRLAGVPNDANIHEFGRNKLDDFAAEDVTFQIEFLDSTKEPILVKMLIDGKDVTSTFTVDTTNDTTSGNTSEQNNIDINVTNSSNTATELEETPVPNKISENNIATSNNFEESTEATNTEQPPEFYEEKEKSSPESNKDTETSELNSSLSDQEKSFDSTHTVIENNSFEDKGDKNILLISEHINVETLTTHENTLPLETSSKSEESIKTIDSDESKSKSSSNTTSDTEYTSAVKQKSPEKDKTTINKSESNETELSKRLESPIKETDKNNVAEDSKNEDKIKDLVAEESICNNMSTLETSESEK